MNSILSKYYGLTPLYYNALAQRTAKKEVVAGQTNYTLYVSDGFDIVAVANQSAQILETYTRGVGLAGDIGTLVAVTYHTGSSTNGTFYTQNNHRGDVVLTRSGTTTVGTCGYSAFGILDSVSGSDVCRFKFSSKERDASTGFSYYGFRFYAPAWQRWPNIDPLGERGAMNLYRFVDNNPMNKIDPDGKIWVWIVGIAIGYQIEELVKHIGEIYYSGSAVNQAWEGYASAVKRLGAVLDN